MNQASFCERKKRERLIDCTQPTTTHAHTHTHTEATANFATRNGIIIGGGGIKLFEDGREVVVRRKGGTNCYTFSVGLLRPSQIKTLLRSVMEAAKDSTIASVDF